MKKNIEQKLIITDNLAGKRLDAALAAAWPEYSRSRIKHWIENGDLTVNGQSVKPRLKLNAGDDIQLSAILETETVHQAEAIPLDIVFEDDHILVLNKPAGLVVHPGAGNPSKTLVNALLHHCPTLEHLPRAGIVHRLDKDTTGLMVVAKTLEAHTHLVKHLQARDVKRRYQAIVYGDFISGGTIEAPIGRHPRHRLKMAVVENGKPAITHFRIIKRFGDFTQCDIELETGRTHQIRVHMAHKLHPIVGDPLYARLSFPRGASETIKTALKNLKRQMLHAYALAFEHPAYDETCEFEIDLPEDMIQFLRILNENET